MECLDPYYATCKYLNSISRRQNKRVVSPFLAKLTFCHFQSGIYLCLKSVKMLNFDNFMVLILFSDHTFSTKSALKRRKSTWTYDIQKHIFAFFTDLGCIYILEWTISWYLLTPHSENLSIDFKNMFSHFSHNYLNGLTTVKIFGSDGLMTL